MAWAANVFDSDTAATLATLYAPNATAPGDASPPAWEWWWSLSGAIGDWVLTCPARRAARKLTALGRPTFVYVALQAGATGVDIQQASLMLRSYCAHPPLQVLVEPHASDVGEPVPRLSGRGISRV